MRRAAVAAVGVGLSASFFVRLQHRLVVTKISRHGSRSLPIRTALSAEVSAPARRR